MAAHLNRVASERATGRMNSAAAYSKTNVDFSAMAAGGHGDHEPVSVELRRICGRSGTDDCESGRHSEGAHANANHGSPHTSFYLRGRFAQRARNVLMEQCAEFQAHLAPQRMHALGAHRISVVLSVPRPQMYAPWHDFHRHHEAQGRGGGLRCRSGLMQGDVNGDTVADFGIKVNLGTMVKSYFLL